MKAILKKAMPIVLSVLLLFVGVAILPTTDVHGANKTLTFKKIFTKPANGVTTPDVTFNFTVTKHSFNGDEAKASECPDLTSMTPTITFTSADNTDGMPEQGLQLTRTSIDLLETVTFTKVGQYTYKIVETSPTCDPNIEGDIYVSKAQYLCSVFVEKDMDGNYFVSKIMGTKLVTDDGTVITNPPKVPYTEDVPGVSSANGVFKNEYRPKGGTATVFGQGTTPSAEELSGFVLKKVIDGESTDASQFTFKLHIDPPWGISTATSNPTYKIVSSTGVVPPENTPIAYSTDTQILLRNGERLVLNDVLLGSFVLVSETDALGYTPLVSGMMHGIPINDMESLATSGAYIGETSGTAETGNWITFTNNQQTPTGVLLANLPFIILFLVAAGGILLFVRNRRRAHSAE